MISKLRLAIRNGKWPSGYGIGGHPVPTGYWKPFLWPFRKKRDDAPAE